MIISIYGKNGAGKTTIATHLAKYLADRNNFVGIISLELRYGSLQRSIGIEVSEQKSIVNALTQTNSKDYFTRYEDNIYVLSLSNYDDITKYDALINIINNDTILEDFYKKIYDTFDYLIVDLGEELINNINFFYIKHSDKLINVTDSRPDNISFSEAHRDIIAKLIAEENTIEILNKHDESIINRGTVENLYKPFDVIVNFDLEIIKNEREATLNKNLIKKMKSITDLLERKIITEVNDNVSKNKFNIFSKIKKLKK